MERKTIDLWVSIGGLIMTVVLIVAGFLLLWGWSYTHDQVRSELSAQKIFFPPANSPAIAAPEFAAMHQYAGQQLTTGPQAHVYANHFIANHLKTIGGGQTYSQLSQKLLADPNNTQLSNQVQQMFQGETLRGLLLNAYAFWTLGTIAGWAAIAAFIAAGLMLVLSILGLWHARRARRKSEPAATQAEAVPVSG
jgi:TRAP-type C4-dicarboxylate transport system permease small subunit